MRELDIGPELRTEIDRVRTLNRRLELRVMPASSVQSLVREKMLAVTNKAGVISGTRGPCFAAAREFGRLARTTEGANLVFEIELWLRKWTALGLPSLALQEFALACLRKFSGPVPIPPPESPKRKRKRRTYERAVKAGICPVGANASRQVEAHRRASERNRAVAMVVREVMAEKRIPSRDFVRYNAFASQFDRRQRRYGKETLATARHDLIDLWTAKDLNPTVLAALSRALSRLPKPD